MQWTKHLRKKCLCDPLLRTDDRYISRFLFACCVPRTHVRQAVAAAARLFNGSPKCLLFLCCLIIILCVSSVNGWWWLCKCLRRRAAWVIITAEIEAFWNSLTAEEETTGSLVCMCVLTRVYFWGFQQVSGPMRLRPRRRRLPNEALSAFLFFFFFFFFVIGWMTSSAQKPKFNSVDVQNCSPPRWKDLREWVSSLHVTNMTRLVFMRCTRFVCPVSSQVQSPNVEAKHGNPGWWNQKKQQLCFNSFSHFNTVPTTVVHAVLRRDHKLRKTH